MDRDTALALLRRQHQFPGEFEFRVVVRPAESSATLSAMVAGAGEGAVLVDVTERRSRNGTYLALHVKMRLPTAERVLDVYEILRALDGVLATM